MGDWVTHSVSADRGVHTITVDKPPGNVFDIALCSQLRPALAEAAEAPDGKVLVVRGAGKHFSFGASVEEHLPDVAPTMLEAFGAVIRDLVAFPYPTVAGVQGSCLGGGLEVALACGIILADEGARLGNPEIQLGVIAPAATALLAGRAAEEILLTGRTLTADEAMRLGIVNALAPSGELDDAIDAFVETHFVPRSALSLRAATKAVRASKIAAVNERLDAAERIYVEELLPTHDGVEGIRAFLEKRSPSWTNA